MSETRYRANLLTGTVDTVEIVNESFQFVDVKYDRSYLGTDGAIIRREAKETATTKICKSKEGAWQAVELHATEQLVLAEQAIRRWKGVLTTADEALSEKQAD